MGRLKERLFAGMAERGVTGELAEDLYRKLAAFANYGFPESHAMSFAYLVFASAWFKRYHPAAFCAALINAQPMGFYSVQSLVDDARRHGVTVLRPDINASGAACTLESPDPAEPARPWVAAGKGTPPAVWGRGGPVVRLGLSQVRTISAELAEQIVRARDLDGPYRDLRDLARRVAAVGRPLTTANVEALATADAFASLPSRSGGGEETARMTRREALWAAGAAAQERPDRLSGTSPGVRAPVLPGMDEIEEMVADVWATGLAPDRHPIQFARDHLAELGAIPIEKLSTLDDGIRVVVGGLVTHRQRPATASGITFLNLEDETGMLNVVCSPGLWQRFRRIARSANAMVIRGRLEVAEGVTNLVAEHLTPLRMPVRMASRDFR
jgi:error-prone DNA polymerase